MGWHLWRWGWFHCKVSLFCGIHHEGRINVIYLCSNSSVWHCLAFLSESRDPKRFWLSVVQENCVFDSKAYFSEILPTYWPCSCRLHFRSDHETAWTGCFGQIWVFSNQMQSASCSAKSWQVQNQSQSPWGFLGQQNESKDKGKRLDRKWEMCICWWAKGSVLFGRGWDCKFITHYLNVVWRFNFVYLSFISWMCNSCSCSTDHLLVDFHCTTDLQGRYQNNSRQWEWIFALP